MTVTPIRGLNVAGKGNAFELSQAILYAGGFPVDNGQGGFVQMKPGRGTALVTDRGQMQITLLNLGSYESVSQPAPGGVYVFPNVPPGEYIVYASLDEDIDGIFGESGEAVGVKGGFMQRPAIHTVLE